MKKQNKEKPDPRHLGIPNINFSCTDEDDEREPLFKKQRQTRGFDDSELWSLKTTIAEFILPRLQAYKENIVSYPCGMSAKKWDKKLAKMIRAFKIVVEDMVDEENDPEFNKGMDLFRKYFLNLWD